MPNKGGLTIYPPVANFLQCTVYVRYQNNESYLAVDKIIAKIKQLTFLSNPAYIKIQVEEPLSPKLSQQNYVLVGLHCYACVVKS